MKRRYWKYIPKKEDYAKLFNNEDKGKLLYARDKNFRYFVMEWDKDNPNLLGWTIGQFYSAYVNNEPTLF